MDMEEAMINRLKQVSCSGSRKVEVKKQKKLDQHHLKLAGLWIRIYI